MTTLQDLRNISYAILKENEDASAFPLVLIDSLLNKAQRNICSGSLFDLRDKQKIQKGSLPFLYKDKFYTTVRDNQLSADTTTGAATLSLSDSSGFATSGKLFINGNVITYTGNTGSGFTGVTGVDFAHLSGTPVSQLYDLPDDYATRNRVIYDNRITLTSKDYRDIYQELNNYKVDGYYGANTSYDTNYDNTNILRPFYTVIQGKYFLPYQVNESDKMIHMIYEKKPTKLIAGKDETTIPEEYADSTIPYIAIGEVLFNRGEEQRGLELWSFGIASVMGMYSYMNNMNTEDLHNQRIRSGKDSVLNI